MTLRLLLAWVVVLTLACDEADPRTDPPPEQKPVAASASAPSYVQPSASVILPGGVRAPVTFSDLAARADPAVVFVETEQAMYGRGRRIVGEGLGSGFVFDPKGLILTNYHVIANATRIDVVFGNDRRMRATIAGTDPPTDVAVLRVDQTGLPHLPFGDSASVRVGDWVLAIGNPFGLSHTVSAGILSAKGRTRRDVEGLDPSGYYDFLQTDASINPGNSGGPLLDTAGRVVGMNTAIKPNANSIGFAIPINMIGDLLPALLEDGKVRRSALGVVVASIRPEDAERLGLDNRSGALVTRVTPGSAGDRAGLKVDDVILAFDGVAGAGPHKLRWLASIAGVGQKVTLRVARGDRQFDLNVTLGELEQADEPEPMLPGLPFP